MLTSKFRKRVPLASVRAVILAFSYPYILLCASFEIMFKFESI
jgi:hypothetical protein